MRLWIVAGFVFATASARADGKPSKPQTAAAVCAVIGKLIPAMPVKPGKLPPKISLVGATVTVVKRPYEVDWEAHLEKTADIAAIESALTECKALADWRRSEDKASLLVQWKRDNLLISLGGHLPKVPAFLTVTAIFREP